MNRGRCQPVPPGSTSTRTLATWLRPHADAFIRYLEAHGIRVTVASTRRSIDTQRTLYANFRAGCSRLPAAPPGRSQHGIGRAFDLHLEPPEYAAAGRVWESIGGTWGGRFRDPVHFEA